MSIYIPLVENNPLTWYHNIKYLPLANCTVKSFGEVYQCTRVLVFTLPLTCSSVFISVKYALKYH